MAALEKIMQMKQQGFTESQILDSLRQEGISPREINEAISQSRIKTELGNQTESYMPEAAGYESANMQLTQVPAQQPIGMQTMQPSIMSSNKNIPETTESQFQEAPAGYSYQGAYPPQPGYPTPAEMSYNEYQPQQTSDIETINDIAEQIVEEKTEALKKQIINFTRFKEELSFEVEKINERLSRIENTFNELQVAILGKIGEYGRDIKDISKEMHATQESFSKIINPLTDNIKALQKITRVSSHSKK